MKKRTLYFLLAWGLILSLPLVFSDKVGGAISPEENRYLAAFPKLSLHSGLPSEVESWINDNAGGRMTLKNLWNDVNINVLNSPRNTENFYIDDWVFLCNDTVLAYLQHSDAMSEEQQASFLASYENIRQYLEQKEIHMGSMVFPHKAQLYEEKFQDYITPLQPQSQLQILETMAQAHPELHMNVLYEEMDQKKQEGAQFYYKAYDASHWNNQGAFFGYQALMENVREAIPDIKILMEEDLRVETVQKEKVYNQRTYAETDLDYIIDVPTASENPDWFASIGFQSADMWNSYRYYQNQDGSLPKLLIVGDSYVWMFMMPWLAESFSETVFIHQLDSGNFLQVVDALNPDAVIFAGLQNCVDASIRQVSASLPSE